MSWVLATTTRKVKWYRIEEGELIEDDILDMDKIELYADKDTAKKTAVALGLKTWRYVKI